jgi:hypothetical protein
MPGSTDSSYILIRPPDFSSLHLRTSASWTWFSLRQSNSPSIPVKANREGISECQIPVSPFAPGPSFLRKFGFRQKPMGRCSAESSKGGGGAEPRLRCRRSPRQCSRQRVPIACAQLHSAPRTVAPLSVRLRVRHSSTCIRGIRLPSRVPSSIHAPKSFDISPRNPRRVSKPSFRPTPSRFTIHDSRFTIHDSLPHPASTPSV